MSDYEAQIQHRIDSEVNPQLRGQYGTMIAIGAIADRLDKIAERLYEIGGLLEDWKDQTSHK